MFFFDTYFLKTRNRPILLEITSIKFSSNKLLELFSITFEPKARLKT